eukprot:CAMPEP_0176181646 /NCGR_PEP_ID=MMETSP0120_2-20121206/93072_1 /TAXON_ID=160619 /ORGANISM="Kryptoperidinium foliaceum, Strain CCMP 1326" /LENGTH=143 /DNA_ID=CAMNT_0017519877 /DNA_START=391 /DNA_END=822 /DNA_ORIENTATION=+
MTACPPKTLSPRCGMTISPVVATREPEHEGEAQLDATLEIEQRLRDPSILHDDVACGGPVALGGWSVGEALHIIRPRRLIADPELRQGLQGITKTTAEVGVRNILHGTPVVVNEQARGQEILDTFGCLGKVEGGRGRVCGATA